MHSFDSSRTVRNLFIRFLPWITVLTAGFIGTTRVVSPSPEFQNNQDLFIGIIIFLLTTILMYFVHSELLRRSAAFKGFETIDSAQSITIATEIVKEMVFYPYRIASYFFITGVGITILLYSLFLAFSGITFTEGLILLFIYLSIFCLWLCPLVIFIFVYSEQFMYRTLNRLFTPEKWLRIDFSDFRFQMFNYRIKQWIVFLLPLTCYLVIFLLVAHHFSALFHPVLIGLSLLVWIYFAVLTSYTSSGIQQASVSADTAIYRSLRKKNISPELLQQLIFYTRDEFGNTIRQLFEWYAQLLPEVERIKKHCSQQMEQLADLHSIAKNQSTVAYSQASALSQLATTMEEIVQSVNQIATDAMKSSQMTQQGLNEVQRGRQFLEQTLDCIEQIHQESLASSQRIMDLSLKMVQIEDVIRIINYVTDHTKILAFNAAIETASAGELGERFGVVATEIRQLAQHISDSTEEIKKIINEVKKTAHASVITTEKELKQVNLAVKTANDAHIVFGDIHTAIEEASNAVSNISAAISQQRLVHEQVWSSIKDIDQSAKELLNKSRSMAELIGKLSAVSDT